MTARRHPDRVPRNYSATLAELYGDSGDRMRNFDVMTPDEKADAIRAMVNGGVSEYAAAAAAKISVEMVRAILGECNARTR